LFASSFTILIPQSRRRVIKIEKKSLFLSLFMNELKENFHDGD
jgi:hypothetical protein